MKKKFITCFLALALIFTPCLLLLSDCSDKNIEVTTSDCKISSDKPLYFIDINSANDTYSLYQNRDLADKIAGSTYLYDIRRANISSISIIMVDDNYYAVKVFYLPENYYVEGTEIYFGL